jgi:hypothetical protein
MPKEQRKTPKGNREPDAEALNVIERVARRFDGQVLDREAMLEEERARYIVIGGRWLRRVKADRG